MQNHLPSGIPKSTDPLFPSAVYRNGQWDMAATGWDTGQFAGELVTFDYDGRSWAQREFEKDHKDWQSLGGLDG